MEPNTPEIIPPKPPESLFIVDYDVTLRGELSGVVVVSGSVLRRSERLEWAAADIHRMLTKAETYPVHNSKYNTVEFVTPEFPPSFSGRTFKDVRVSVTLLE